MSNIGSAYTAPLTQTAASSSSAAPTTAAGTVSALATQSLGAPVTSSAVQVRGDLGTGAQPGTNFDGNQADDAVQANAAHKAPVDLKTLSDMETRKTFVQNITQLDGDKNTTTDQQSCGPTALIQGMTMADPKSTQALANGILLQSGSSEGKKMFPGGVSDYGEALRAIRDGNASPAQFQQLAQLMGQAKGVEQTDKQGNNLGTSVDGMGQMVSDATKLTELGGGKMPNVELDMFSDTKKLDPGAHWEAAAGGVEIDPWPNAQGKSTLTSGPAGLAQGASHYDNGAVNSKVFVSNGGKNLQINRFQSIAGEGTNQSRVTTSDPSTPLATYQYKQNTFGYGYTRTSGDAPSNVNPQQEPGQELGKY